MNAEIPEAGEPLICEFCGDPALYIQQCDDCGVDTHEDCMCGGLCPWCYEWKIDSRGLGEE